MPKKVRSITEWDKLNLEDDGILSVALQDAVHDMPQHIHYVKVAEVCGFTDESEVPRFACIADLVAFVVSVRAASADDKSLALLFERFSPKASRSALDVTNVDTSMPVSSNSAEEQQQAEDYMHKLKHA